MDISKKRKPGAKKRKSRTATAPKLTIKIAGAGSFSKNSCHSTKTSATKQADRIRAQGNKARVIKSGKAHCVYKGGKMKANSVYMKMRKRRAA
jgi:hypothetical protein